MPVVAGAAGAAFTHRVSRQQVGIYGCPNWTDFSGNVLGQLAISVFDALPCGYDSWVLDF
ncbi:hypothetical protein DXZ20_35170 [Leptolyngbyaceae cyanobacterium CCMR0081]|uniref:Uncharacterized protein n=1 Tax=Adonisia turfae CCMR0081 TaxID=2292702 RepID=A0A6M0RYK6_9CYAN|nr:hypothetical protein [Adonisia turfae CCMR0081]